MHCVDTLAGQIFVWGNQAHRLKIDFQWLWFKDFHEISWALPIYAVPVNFDAGLHRAMINKKDYRLSMWKMIVRRTWNTKVIAEWNNMRGIIKVIFGKSIRTIIKSKHQQKIPLHYVKLTHQLSFRNRNLKLTIAQEAHGSSTAPNTTRRISC